MLSRRHFLGASLATTVYAAGSFVPVWAQISFTHILAQKT